MDLDLKFTTSVQVLVFIPPPEILLKFSVEYFKFFVIFFFFSTNFHVICVIEQ